MNCYTIRDNAADYFFPPFFARTHGEAKRMFISSLGDSFVHRHDYILFSLGTWDADEGILTADEAPSVILAGASIAPEMDPRPQQPTLPLESSK